MMNNKVKTLSVSKSPVALAVENAFKNQESHHLPLGVATYDSKVSESVQSGLIPSFEEIDTRPILNQVLITEVEHLLLPKMEGLIDSAQLEYEIQSGTYGFQHLTPETIKSLITDVDEKKQTRGGDSADTYSRSILTFFATRGDERLWLYNGKCWSCVNDIHAKSNTARLIEGCGGTLKNADKALAVNDLIVSLADPLPPQQDGINVANGFLVCEDGAWKLKPHDSEYGQINCLPFAYLPDARCYRWHHFLEEVQPDPAVRHYLQELFGFIILGKLRPHLERFFVFTGSGQNGKSVALEILSRLIGEDNISRLSMDKFEPRNLEMLVGKIANIGSETEHSTKMSTSLFKQAVSGEPLLAEPKYRAHYAFISQAALVFAVNAMPPIDDRSDGIWRRMALIPWPVTIDKPDPTLKHTLTHEMSGILNWALEGALRILQNRRFDDPPTIKAAGAKLRTENNSVALFTNDCADINQEHRISKQDAYDAYVHWARRSGYKTLSKHNFGREITRLLGTLKGDYKVYYPYLDIYKTEHSGRPDAYPFYIRRGIVRRSYRDLNGDMNDYDGAVGQQSDSLRHYE